MAPKDWPTVQLKEALDKLRASHKRAMTATVKTESSRLPDTATHINRFEICSETSSRKYIASQRRTTMKWECSCMSWKSNRQKNADGDRTCKHLDAINPSKAKAKPAFSEGYDTYDGPPGNPQSWKDAFKSAMGSSNSVPAQPPPDTSRQKPKRKVLY